MHIDTGHNFDELYTFRDQLIKETGGRLIIASVQKSIDNGKVVEESGINSSRNKLQTTTLLDSIEEYQFDCAIGGARRDEEKAKELRNDSFHRDEFGQWNPKNQRPELWNILMEKKIWENILEHFQLVIGLKWIFGSIF